MSCEGLNKIFADQISNYIKYDFKNQKIHPQYELNCVVLSGKPIQGPSMPTLPSKQIQGDFTTVG